MLFYFFYDASVFKYLFTLKNIYRQSSVLTLCKLQVNNFYICYILPFKPRRVNNNNEKSNITSVLNLEKSTTTKPNCVLEI